MADKTTINIDKKAIEQIFSEITFVEKRLEQLKLQVVKVLSIELGSDEWWKKETEEGLEEIKQGQTIKFSSMKEAIKYLES